MIWLFSPLPFIKHKICANSCPIGVQTVCVERGRNTWKYFQGLVSSRLCSCWQSWRWLIWSFVPSGGRTSTYFSMGEMSVLTSKVLVWDMWWWWLLPSPLKIHPNQTFPRLFSPSPWQVFQCFPTFFFLIKGLSEEAGRCRVLPQFSWFKTILNTFFLKKNKKQTKTNFSLVLLVRVLMCRRSCVYK